MNPDTTQLNCDPADHSQHVTAVITHRVRSGRQDVYDAWIKGIIAVA